MPHEQPRRSRLALADTPNAVALARLHTADVLSGWGVSCDIVETAKLLVSELATNAVRHSEEGEAPAQPFSSESGAQTFELFAGGRIRRRQAFGVGPRCEAARPEGSRCRCDGRARDFHRVGHEQGLGLLPGPWHAGQSGVGGDRARFHESG